MQRFKATHEICAWGHRYRVMLVNGETGAGPAYTYDEWRTGTTADWERDEAGFWTFQGGGSYQEGDTVFAIRHTRVPA